MIKYTIIMPVYNAGKFIESNLKKFQKIKREDIELIIINDGSKDESLDIINKYKNDIKNIIVINQSNKGVSYSRNLGIERANGEYVSFLDCDDSLTEDYFEKLDQYYEQNFDLIRFNYNIVYNKQIKRCLVSENKKTYTNFSKSEERLLLIYTGNKMNTIWNQIVKREILIKNKILFQSEYKYAEDFEFNKQLTQYTDKVCFITECLYNYYIHSNSISRCEQKENVIKCIDDAISIHSKSYFECKKIYKDNLEKVFKNISLEFMTVVRRLFFIRQIKIKEVKLILLQLQKNEQIQKIIRDKKSYNWKTNLFIDHCLYRESGTIRLLFFKFYFILKNKIKILLYY